MPRTQIDAPVDVDRAREQLETLIHAACILEAAAPKAGNVHPGAAFDDVSFGDFVASADAAAPVLACSAELGVGRTILEAVIATRRTVSTNTNLGIILLLAPLAAVPTGVTLCDGIGPVLDGLTQEDAVLAFEAIRLARPGGLGQVEKSDVRQPPTGTLRDVMALAADRDLIARQYVDRFSLVLDTGVGYLVYEGRFEQDCLQAIVGLHLALLSRHRDSLIARKCGPETADEVSRRAAAVRDCPWPDGARSRELFAGFDRWLRASSNRRNPGTTADLVAASLFALFRDGGVAVPQAVVARNARQSRAVNSGRVREYRDG
jgi:triphosphoribosyl-dephospho-CoA synthase